MYTFGLQLAGEQAQITRAPGDPNSSGPTFPSNPTNGRVWNLTAVVGANQPGLYVYSTVRAKWVNQLQSVNPYDVGLSILKRYAGGQEIARYLSVRTTAIIKNFAGSMANADVAATAQAVFKVSAYDTVTQAVIQLGTITFGAGSKTGVFAPLSAYLDTEIILVAGDQLRVVAPDTADTTLNGVAITIAGRLLV
ncbi:hypothetical protein MPK70_gp095 [Erwinia phage pEa_SNUABM_33]|uniref:Tail fiber protein n=2 Tax=Alexandravirus TaxID=2733088 RepID=A0A384ZY34_9CAUD|nr:hypothetical protein HOU09_gp092 [Dickeya phage vB_DsoM_AD1]YP_010301877.1 hypothetical protein MPK70_gp095 [Erwinia phage pEa_SNUABM_33]AXG67136.1 hypothetical protein AD1_092 [Dickeya phage vB_DsoM_AD1]QZE57971.1 hypothetical protein pEaSNUABM33_00095 [Erwinia phage pEa_SNUABM_33]WAK44373.1 hypothetical protein [Erwinia phage vB_Ea_2910A]